MKIELLLISESFLQKKLELNLSHLGKLIFMIFFSFHPLFFTTDSKIFEGGTKILSNFL